jgi:predicted AlkP superfamily pyrophosphatase or phosphodiesterase
MVLSDALRDDTAADQMGYLEHLVEVKKATRFTVIGELPSMSRPMYETVHTGVPVSVHGVTGNLIVRRSKMPNLFEEAVKHGRTTAASAYWWFSELYNKVPYDPVSDREVDDTDLGIQHGRFYMEDSTPDREVFLAGATLVRRFDPDYVLIHPMGMDWMGENYGSDSSEYRNQAIRQDMLAAHLIPEWLKSGYMVFFTADHGMNDDRLHGGTTEDVRNVPLYIIPPGGAGRGRLEEKLSQLRLAPTVLRLLGVPIPTSMEVPPIDLGPLIERTEPSPRA